MYRILYCVIYDKNMIFISDIDKRARIYWEKWGIKLFKKYKNLTYSSDYK
jgi:hypothetical protein